MCSASTLPYSEGRSDWRRIVTVQKLDELLQAKLREHERERAAQAYRFRAPPRSSFLWLPVVPPAALLTLAVVVCAPRAEGL
jgi:hypothetical protein